MHRFHRYATRAAAAVAVGALVTVGLGRVAAAHITIAEPEHVAGAYTLLTFGVPHGCDGSPTTAVRIQMPESIPQVTPTVNPNWDVEKVMEELPEPIEASHGQQITERVAEVVYAATTPLPDGYRDALVLNLQVPADAAGQTIYFPVIQTCEEGETAWIEIPAARQDGEELEAPAPSIEVVAAPSTDAPAGGGESAAAGGDVVADDDDGGGSDTLAIAALVVGILGLGVGGVALVQARKR